MRYTNVLLITNGGIPAIKGRMSKLCNFENVVLRRAFDRAT